MKAKELAELLLENPDHIVDVSVDISKDEKDTGARTFGKIIDMVNSARGTTLVCTGELNTELDNHERRLLDDLTKLWYDACEVAREYCPVDVGKNHFKDGIPLLAKRVADAEKERDELRARLIPPKVRESLVAALGIPPEFLGLEPSDKKLLDDLKRLWANACTVARSYCPVPNVGDDHITQGIPLLAKRAADAEAERDKLLEKIDAYRADRRGLEPLHWAFAEYDNMRPLKPDPETTAKTNDWFNEIMSKKPWQPLERGIDTKAYLKELELRLDTRLIEELSIASIVKVNEELKKRVEVLEIAVEYLNGEKK